MFLPWFAYVWYLQGVWCYVDDVDEFWRSWQALVAFYMFVEMLTLWCTKKFDKADNWSSHVLLVSCGKKKRRVDLIPPISLTCTCGDLNRFGLRCVLRWVLDLP